MQVKERRHIKWAFLPLWVIIADAQMNIVLKYLHVKGNCSFLIVQLWLVWHWCLARVPGFKASFLFFDINVKMCSQ